LVDSNQEIGYCARAYHTVVYHSTGDLVQFQWCQVQVQKVKVLLGILFQSPRFANAQVFSQEIIRTN